MYPTDVDPFQDLVDTLRWVLQPARQSIGAEENCSGFVLQCRLAIKMHPTRFASEGAKIAFVISLLTGRALQWAEAVWQQGGSIMQSFDSFIRYFKEVFGRPQGDTSVSDQLYHLQQGQGSIQEYTIRFSTLATSSGWKDQVRGCMEAPRGTEASIRHQLQNPDLLEPPVEPMQVDYSWLFSAKRHHRRTQGLCLYGGQGGHLLGDCPTCPPRTPLPPSSTPGRPPTSSRMTSATDSDSRK